MRLDNITPDPLTIVRDYFWRVVESNPFFSDWVRDGNKIKYNDEIGEKKQIGHGDLPEITIIPTMCNQDGLGTSHTGYLSTEMLVHVVTGTRDLRLISALQWEIFRCIQTFMATAGNLRYNDREFFALARLTSGAQTLSSTELNRGIEGWTATWGVRIDLQFSNADLHFEVT